MEMTEKSTTKTMVILKTRRSTPRRVLKTDPALLPPKALPSPAPRTCKRIKPITTKQRMICTILIAGSHCCNKELFLSFECTEPSLDCSERLYHRKWKSSICYDRPFLARRHHMCSFMACWT